MVHGSRPSGTDGDGLDADRRTVLALFVAAGASGALPARAPAATSDAGYDSGSYGAGPYADGTTGSDSQPPTIDQFDVSERGSPNPHAEIDVDWEVSDADGDLDSVEIVVTDESGSRVDSSTTSVSGSSAAGSEYFKIKRGGGATYDCTLTVTDAASQSASETKRVSA